MYVVLLVVEKKNILSSYHGQKEDHVGSWGGGVTGAGSSGGGLCPGTMLEGVVGCDECGGEGWVVG